MQRRRVLYEVDWFEDSSNARILASFVAITRPDLLARRASDNSVAHATRRQLWRPMESSKTYNRLISRGEFGGGPTMSLKAEFAYRVRRRRAVRKATVCVACGWALAAVFAFTAVITVGYAQDSVTAQDLHRDFALLMGAAVLSALFPTIGAIVLLKYTSRAQ